MIRAYHTFKPVFAALTISVASLGAGVAEADQLTLNDLFVQLGDPDLEQWEQVEEQIWDAWADSGSPTMDLLLKRGRDALEDGEFAVAAEHLTALTDHAPGFAEGWNLRALAFFQMEEFGLAMADIEKALALNPRHFAALSGLGSILVQLNEPREALKFYRSSLAIHPHQAHVKEAIKRLERDLGGREI